MSEVQELYSNSVQVNASLYDVTLRLYLQTDVDPEAVQGTEIARLRMSPQQAMAVYLLLGKVLRAYGETFQEVFLPEELRARLSGVSEELPGTDTIPTDTIPSVDEEAEE